MNPAAVIKGYERLKLYLALLPGLLVVVLAVAGWVEVLFTVMGSTASAGAPPF